MSVELRILHKRVKSHGYILEKQLPLRDSKIVIENFFKTKHEKNALLSYIIYPFIGLIQKSHSNHQECYLIAQILSDLGYNVDVINWDNTTFLPNKQYDVVIDNHNNLERLACYFSNTTKIFHATNAHWLFQNFTEYNRSYNHYIKTGTSIKPSRLIPPGNSAEHCDVITMFGNEFTKNTYGKYASKVFHLPMSVTTITDDLIKRNYSSAKTKFLWLNSHGPMLKGLDIVISAFLMSPTLELYVCGDFSKDTSFIESFGEDLFNAPNIKFVGWIDVQGEAFNAVVSSCAWVVSTSFSEGGGGSILNCMGNGLIPIVSETVSIDITDNYHGFYLKENSAEQLCSLINKLVNVSEERMEKLAFNAWNYIRENHTLVKFQEAFKLFLMNQSKQIKDV